ncbi:Arc family DNA-binding protein [bacterium]|nr:Arc family DNA-binding protein [bacterium]
MPAITVKNIPDTLYDNLKQSANLNHRSINSEIIACLEKELMHKKLATDQIIKDARLLRARFKGKKADIKDIQSFISEGRE